jgi:hypothetical protein
MQDRMDKYVASLSKSRYKVVIFDDELERLLLQQADSIADINERAGQQGVVNVQPDSDLQLQPWVTQPPQQ